MQLRTHLHQEAARIVRKTRYKRISQYRKKQKLSWQKDCGVACRSIQDHRPQPATRIEMPPLQVPGDHDSPLWDFLDLFLGQIRELSVDLGEEVGEVSFRLLDSVQCQTRSIVEHFKRRELFALSFLGQFYKTKT